MRIIELNSLGIHTPTATVYTSKEGKMYFNYKVGLRYKNCKEYTLGFSNKCFKPLDKNDKLILDKDNYNIIPILKDDKQLIDRNNNPVYSIYEDNTLSHKNSTIVFWEVPTRNYEGSIHSLDGLVDQLAVATSGVLVNDKMKHIPILMLLVYGDCELKVQHYNDIAGKILAEQLFKFHSSTNKWDIGEVKIRS